LYLSVVEKMSTNYLDEAQSLVDLLANYQQRSTGSKLATTGSSSRPQHHQSLKGSITGTTRITTATAAHPYDDFVNKIRALKTQLEQKDAAIAERDLRVQQQAAIIEALVQKMSEMEDDLNCHSDDSTGVYGDTVFKLQEENEHLAMQVEWLESQLVDAKRDARMLKNVLKGKIIGREGHARKQDVLFESSHQASAKKLNAALQLAESENEDLTKQLQLLQSSLAESNRVTSVWSTKCVELQRELGRTGKSEFVLKDSTQKTAKQRPSRAIAA